MNIANVLSAAASSLAMDISTNVATAPVRNDGLDFSASLSDAKQGNVKKNVDTGSDKTDVSRKDDRDIDKAVSKLSGKVKSIDNKAPDVDSDKLEGLEEDFKKALSDALGIDVEDLEKVMEELSLTVFDLTQPSNIMQLMLQVNDLTDASQIVFDSDLTAVYKEAQAASDNFLKSCAEEGVSKTDIEKFDLAKTFAPEENTEPVVNSEKEPVVPVEVKNTETETKDSGERKESNNQPKEEADQAGRIVNNLNNSIREAFAVSGGEEVTQVTEVDVDDILRQVNESIRVNMTPDTKSIEIQLNPQNLGHVTIQVVSRNGGLYASVAAGDEAVKRALESQLVTLKTNLENQGIKVENVEVVLAGRAFSQQDEARQDGSGSSGGKRRRNISLDDSADIEEIRVNENEESSDNIINYKA